MERSWYTRLVLVLLVTLGAIWLLVPSYYSFFVLEKKDRNNVELLREKLPGWAKPAARFRLSLGLDLQGGIHTVMRVDTKTALEKRVERQGLRMANWVKEKKLGEITTSTNPDKLELTLKATDPAAMDAIEKEVLDVFLDYSKVSREGAALTLALRQGAVDGFVEESVGQAMLVIRRRIDKWGVAEVDVRKVGTDSIQISLPGQQDPEQAKELIGTTAQLEFRIVDTGQAFSEIYKNNPPEQGSGITLINDSREGFPQLSAENREVLLAYVKGKAPENREILLHCVESESKKKSCSSYTTFLVEKEVPLTGESLTGADARQNTTNNQAEVNFQFDAAGARDLDNLTAKNVGHRMAVVLDDNVVMAPTIESRISGGSGVITLGRQGKLEDRMKEAHTTAITLKAGALPAPVTVGEVRQVGASLGDELVKRGSTAAGVGLLLVIVFMAIYYKVSGLVADVALVLNGALILSGLAFFGGTLTLPGIAGFVLTLGIAVDANVLINERIREELSLGKTARSAVDQGYDRAFWTIFDAHVTTLIAGFILAFTGTGPVQGFATALIIGIIASLFTSIVVTRLIVTWLVHGRNAQSVSV